MKKLFTLLAAFALFVTTSFAQRNLYYWGKNGDVSIEPASQVDSLTFSVGSWLYKISKPVSLGATTNSFQGSTKVAMSDKVKSIDVTPEVGICYSDVNKTPTYEDAKQKLGSSMSDYSFTIKKDIDGGTTYYYRTYVKLLDEVYYSAVNSITTMGEKPKVINGHKFIDLGLPSGLLWAKTNVGASSSLDDGDYFAWGETEPKSFYSWSTYKWGGSPSKYNYRDGKTILDAEDDAATINWGEGCRMPSREEFVELLNKCDWSWQSDYNGSGVRGYLVTGSNGNFIFIPASGYRYGSVLNSRGSSGNYWSSSLNSSNTNDAYHLNFSSGSIAPSDYDGRYYGYPVRPVAEK